MIIVKNRVKSQRVDYKNYPGKASFLYELHHGHLPSKFAGCVTPDEVALSHKLFTAALKSEKDDAVISL